MTDRERFEAWAKSLAYNTARQEQKPDLYQALVVTMLWDAWQAASREAQEEAAKVCDDISTDRWNLYKGRAPYNGSEDGRANSYVEGESDGAEKCAVAIRALAGSTEG